MQTLDVKYVRPGCKHQNFKIMPDTVIVALIYSIATTSESNNAT